VTVTSDGRFVVIGTEKGELLVWGVGERRITKRLDQGSPVHCVVAIDGTHSVIAAGGPHSGGKNFCVVHRWGIDNGTFLDLRGAGRVSNTALSVDSKRGFVVAAALGRIAAWNLVNGELVSSTEVKQFIISLALSERTIAVTAMSLESATKPSVSESPASSI